MTMLCSFVLARVDVHYLMSFNIWNKTVMCILQCSKLNHILTLNVILKCYFHMEERKLTLETKWINVIAEKKGGIAFRRMNSYLNLKSI